MILRSQNPRSHLKLPIPHTLANQSTGHAPTMPLQPIRIQTTSFCNESDCSSQPRPHCDQQHRRTYTLVPLKCPITLWTTVSTHSIQLVPKNVSLGSLGVGSLGTHRFSPNSDRSKPVKSHYIWLHFPPTMPLTDFHFVAWTSDNIRCLRWRFKVNH